MELKKTGAAGTYESSDIFVTVNPGRGKGIEIDLSSTVEKQFGDEIRKVIRETLTKLDVKDAEVAATDTGALDCVVRARTMTAVHRAAGMSDNIDWEEIDKWTN